MTFRNLDSKIFYHRKAGGEKLGLLNSKQNLKKIELARMRWLILTCGIILFLIAGLSGGIRSAIIAFGLGIISGFFVDWLGIKKFRFWNYSRQRFLSPNYFIFALPDWGVISLIINFIWNWLQISWLSFAVVAGVLFVTHDLPNLKTKSWHYYAPLWLVIIGWIVYILAIRISFLILS